MTIIAKGIASRDFGESQHWYTRDGRPMYEVPSADGKMRPTTLRDARKLDLVPSVSTIMQMEAKPQLTRWLVEQGMLACLTLPRREGESDQDFMARALDDSKAQSRKAADRGTYLHGLMEESIRSNCCVAEPPDRHYVYPALSFLWDNFGGYDWYVERSFAHPKGFGGKVDLSGTHPWKRPVVVDYKCKDFVADTKKKLAYDEHVTQLAAYSKGLGLEDPRCVNLFISTREPGVFIAHEWEREDIRLGWDAFCSLHDLWVNRKRFF